jgi:hypothetical protein
MDRLWYRALWRHFGDFALTEEDLTFLPLKKQQTLQKNMLFPYENMIFSSSIRKAIEKLCSDIIFIGGFST